MTGPSHTVLKAILVSFLALLLISPARISSWQYDHAGIKPMPDSNFPIDTHEVVKSQRASLENGKYCLQVKESSASIDPCDMTKVLPTWQSPQTWQVQEGFFADLNRDGITEAVLLVRRPFAPWPIDRFLPSGGRIRDFQDKEGYSCHVILITLRDGMFREAWAGSSMVQPIRQLVAADLDGDGYEELAAIEYKYDQSSRRGSLVIWNWNGFGFSLGTRKAGHFSSLTVFKNQLGTWLVTE